MKTVENHSTQPSKSCSPPVSGPASYFTALATRNKFARDALRVVEDVMRALQQCETLLDRMRESGRQDDIVHTLSAVDDVVSKQRERLAAVKHRDAADAVTTAVTKLETIEAYLQAYAELYPSQTPLRIDNARLRSNDFASVPHATLIAYCLALVSRIYHRTSRPGASFELKLTKLFGRSLVALAGGPNILQRQALDATPDDVRTVESRLNLGVKTIPYAVCPLCRCTYKPTYTPPSEIPRYQQLCSEEKDDPDGICGQPLVDEKGRARQIFEYYPFFDWFGRLLALPGMQDCGERFCVAVDKNPQSPSEKHGVEDGTLVRTFPAARDSDRLFIADRGDEKRWLFALHVDFFNVEGNSMRGRKASTGQIVVTCLNLPLSLRNDDAYRYLGIIQGPHEPSARDAAYRHYLRPLIQDLEVGYTRGVRFNCTPTAGLHQASMDLAYRFVHRTVLAAFIADLKGARPCGGQLDVTSHFFCFICRCWIQAYLGRVDFESWEPIDDERLRRGAKLWREAPFAARQAIEQLFGTRDSMLWLLSYWKPSQQIVVDPMHTWFLLVLQRFFREAMGLDGGKKGKWTHRRPAFHYDFTPPPPLSALSSDQASDDESDEDDDGEGVLTYKAAVDMGKIHKSLVAPLDNTEAAKRELAKYLTGMAKSALLQTCLDLKAETGAEEETLRGLRKVGLAQNLLAWRMTKPLEAMPWTPIDRESTVDAIRKTLSEVSVPTWVKDVPPLDLGASRAGTLKANSPFACSRARELRPILAMNMNLTINTIILVKHTVTDTTQRRFREQLRAHVLGLRQHFPGFMFPGYHLAFHIPDFMSLLGPARNWWCFPFERLAGRLQRIPKNHIEGANSEHTMLHAFLKGSIFRQWLLRPNSPPVLQYCRFLLDKTYRFLSGDASEKVPATEVDTEEEEEEEEDNAEHQGMDEDAKAELKNLGIDLDRAHRKKVDHDLLGLAGSDDISCYSLVGASKGFYGVKGGNSYVCVRPQAGSRNGRWTLARIRYIFKYRSGELRFIVQRAKPKQDSRRDVFADYWEQGFEAQWISAEFKQEMDVIGPDEIIAHAARWVFSDGTAVVVNLSDVSRRFILCCHSTKSFF
ncbi:hypothetical protein FB107DRAFT_225208 [Schizophyllum commune]